jgi:polysaccharide pyruvyl transferase WcaK-like protein
MGIQPFKKIAILGHVGTKNLGDEAIIAAVIHQIGKRYPTAQIIGFTGDPDDTRARHGIPAFPLWRTERPSHGVAVAAPSRLARFAAWIRAASNRAPGVQAFLKTLAEGARLFVGVFGELRFLARCRRRLNGADVLIFAGSNQLNDYVGGPWGFPYTLLKWSLVAKGVGAKIVFLCCGAGPLDSRLGKLFIKASLLLADYRSYRDEVSLRLVESIGVGGPHSVCTDLAYGLKPVPPAAAAPARPRLLVGLNPLPYFDARYWSEHDADVYARYIGKMADFAEWLNARGHHVAFFPTQLRADPLVIDDIRAVLKDRGLTDFEHAVSHQPMSSVHDLIARISTMDIVVAARYHGILLAALVHRPILAIAYHQKSADLMAQIRQADYVVDIDTFDLKSLAKCFTAIESRTATIRAELEQSTRIVRQAVEAEYDRVFRWLSDARGVGGAADVPVMTAAPLNGSQRVGL